MACNSGFLRQIDFSYESFIQISGILNTANIFIGAKRQERNTAAGSAQGIVTVWCAANASAVVDSYYFDDELVRGVNYYQVPDSQSDQKLTNFRRMHIYGRMEPNFILYAPCGLFRMKCFPFQRLKEIAQQADQQDPLM